MDEIKRHGPLEARLWVQHNSKHVITPTIISMLAENDDLRARLAAITAAIGDRQRIADALTEVADYHVTECVDMHGDQGEDGPGDGCCFHARAAYRVGDAARLLRGAASLSPTPTPDRCPQCGSTNPGYTAGGCWDGNHPWHKGGQP